MTVHPSFRSNKGYGKSYAFISSEAWASAAGGAVDPWIFIHGTDIVDRGLIVLFFGLFLLFFDLFSVAPLSPRNFFSADALTRGYPGFKKKRKENM